MMKHAETNSGANSVCLRRRSGARGESSRAARSRSRRDIVVVDVGNSS